MVLESEAELLKPDSTKTIVEWLEKSGQLKSNGKLNIRYNRSILSLFLGIECFYFQKFRSIIFQSTT